MPKKDDNYLRKCLEEDEILEENRKKLPQRRLRHFYGQFHSLLSVHYYVG